ncbi:MAG TPA: NCS2 family permease [Actinomycetota bacterium]|nr:NCS2 family permease [Actinomycetota bacterium]
MATWAPPRPATAGENFLDRYFRISERGSTVRTELIAGAATWLTMAYIIFVNPSILGTIPDRLGNFVSGGPQFEAGKVAAATALVAGVLTLLMGVYANYPFAMAAGLGLNAFVTFTLVGTFQLTWPQAMGVIVWEGLMITLLVLTRFREYVMDAIPMDLKRAIGVGIGAFIAFIGLVNAGIVVHPEAGPIVTLNPDLRSLKILVFVIGLAITMILVARRVKGALLGGIVLTTVVAAIINVGFTGSTLYPPGVAELPERIVSVPDLSIVGNFSLNLQGIAIGTAMALVISVMLSDFFDTMGTVVGIAGEAGLLDREGKLPGIQRVLLVDSLGAAAGGAASVSSNTTYIESAAGVSEGGRTGLTSVVTAVLFFAALFLASLAGTIPSEATAPVLIMVGYFMMTIVKDINWSDAALGIPALVTILMQPLTFSITNGVGAGFIAYTVIRLLQGDGVRDTAFFLGALARGRWAELRDRQWRLHPIMLLVSGIFGWYFWKGLLA